MENLVTKTVKLNTGSPLSKREEIREYFHQTIKAEERLFETFANERAYYLRADPLRHPLIFYFGHTAVFYVNKLILAKLLPQRINPEFESIFAVGVDEMSWDDLNESNYNWPSVEEVKNYRKSVWEKVNEMIDTLPLNIPVKWDDPFWVILMGIEHQRIHLETSTMLIRQLPLEVLKVTDFWELKIKAEIEIENKLVPIKGGKIRLGKEYDHELYGWDNEYGKTFKQVSDFEASRYLVSNREFLQFVEDQGYLTREYWTEEGWSWREYTRAEYPRFWLKKEDGTFVLRTMLEIIPIPWDWPVEVNYLEAKAFCNWKSNQTHQKYRLPTEAEYLAMYEQYMRNDQPDWPVAPGNINLEHYKSPCSVAEFDFGGIFDVVGNVWQWTETPIDGYPGFRIHPCYDDFSTPTFDTRHNLFKGGAWISTGNEATKYARYAFRRHFFQYAGIRYIVSPDDVEIVQTPFESDNDVALRCEFDYGKVNPEIGNFSKNAVEFCLKYVTDGDQGEALNIGCNTGRVAFEMARYFDKVIGIDFTARYIKMAIRMQETGSVKYILKTEGDLEQYCDVSAEQLNISKVLNKVEFWQGDASNLKPHFKNFDLIYIHDVLDVMYDPASVLKSLHHRLKPEGILIISSGYDWDENITTKEKWLSGIRISGEPVTGLEGISSILDKHFELVDTDNSFRYQKYLNKRKSIQKTVEFSVWRLREK